MPAWHRRLLCNRRPMWVLVACLVHWAKSSGGMWATKVLIIMKLKERRHPLDILNALHHQIQSLPKHNKPRLVKASLAPVGVFSGFSIRFVDDDTDARGVFVMWVVLSVGSPPLPMFLGCDWSGGCCDGAVVGVEPTIEPIDAADKAETFSGCWGLVARPGRGPGFGGGRCFNILKCCDSVEHVLPCLPSFLPV